MSETTQDPVEQDPDVLASRVRLYRFLGLLRLLAGRRGHSRITWWGQGFRYTLTAERVEREPYSADTDPDVEDRGALARWFQALLLLSHDDADDED